MRAASLFLLFLPGKWHWAAGAPAWVQARGWPPALVLRPELYPEPQGLLPLGPQTGLANPPESGGISGCLLNPPRSRLAQAPGAMLFVSLPGPPGSRRAGMEAPKRGSEGLGFALPWGQLSDSPDLGEAPGCHMRVVSGDHKGPARPNIRSFNRYLWSAYSVPGAGIGPGDAVTKRQTPALRAGALPA